MIFLSLILTNSHNNLSFNKSPDIPSAVRPFAKYTPQTVSLDTTSDISLETIPSTSNISLQTIPSASNVLVQTHNIGYPPPNLDPPPAPSLTNRITTQSSTSHSPYR